MRTGGTVLERGHSVFMIYIREAGNIGLSGGWRGWILVEGRGKRMLEVDKASG
jgi:hypothetical protein